MSQEVVPSSSKFQKKTPFFKTDKRNQLLYYLRCVLCNVFIINTYKYNRQKT
jgi:hypothetical protein